MKLSQGRFRWILGERIFTQRVVWHRNRLTREVVTAPSMTRVQEAFGQHSQAPGVTFGAVL